VGEVKFYNETSKEVFTVVDLCAHATQEDEKWRQIQTVRIGPLGVSVSQ